METVIKKTEVYKFLENELKQRLIHNELVITSNEFGISIVPKGKYDSLICIDDIVLFSNYNKLLCYIDISEEHKPRVCLFK